MRMLSDNMLWMRQLESLSRTSGIIHVADPHEEIKFTHTPIHYKAKPVVARYKEREVDSELTCPECGVIFQVFGIFGFCPGCRSENQAIYAANLAIVRQEIASAPDGDRALRHAYSDLGISV
jgi:hypothetical protein